MKKIFLFIFLITIYIINTTQLITVQKNLLNQFINTVKYVQYSDSVKTQIIKNKQIQINYYKDNIKLLNNKILIDSLLILNKNKQIQNIRKQNIIPFYKSKQMFFTYGIVLSILIFSISNNQK